MPLDQTPFPIQGSFLYSRQWLIENFPGMHVARLIRLQKFFGLLPINSGNRHAPFLYEGGNLMSALMAEARYHFGDSTNEEKGE